MRLVLASRQDAPAAALVHAWGGEAALLVPADLSQRGWRFDPDDVAHSVAVVAGAALPCDRITGVLTLLPWVFEPELTHIVAEDRPYVAAELSAFLLAWLHALPCPVVNRPQPGCLAGPAWAPERWRHEAVRCGLRLSALPGAGDGANLCIVGGECFGEGEAAQCEAVRRLAGAAGVEVLTVHLDAAGAFQRAAPRPDLSQPPVAEALAGLLAGRRR